MNLSGRARAFLILVVVLALGAGALGASGLRSRPASGYVVVGPATAASPALGSGLVRVEPPVIAKRDSLRVGSNWTLYGEPVAPAMIVRDASAAAGGVAVPAARVGIAGTMTSVWILSRVVEREGGVARVALPLAASIDRSVRGPTTLFVSQYDFETVSIASAFFGVLDDATRHPGWVVDALANPDGDLVELPRSVTGAAAGVRVLCAQWVAGDDVLSVALWGSLTLSAAQVIETLFPASVTGLQAAPSRRFPGANDEAGASLSPADEYFASLPWASH